MLCGCGQIYLLLGKINMHGRNWDWIFILLFKTRVEDKCIASYSSFYYLK